MLEPSSDQLMLINARKPVVRALVILPVLVALVGAWYATRWYIGDFVAEFAPKMTDENLSETDNLTIKMETALAALRFAPQDPRTHLTYAYLKKMSMAPGDMEEALRHYEEAVRLSPNDYYLWMELGRARGQAADLAGGEKALRRAVELAPSYPYPHWYLGNLLLRAGRGDEAFTELRRASDAYPKLRSQIFNAAWVVYQEDVNAIKEAVGASAAARAELAVYVTGRGRFEDAVALWSSLTPSEKQEQRSTGELLMNALLQAKRYRAASGIFHDLNPKDSGTRTGEIMNPGFESDVEATGQNIFGWKVTLVPEAQIGVDDLNRHEGARSLRVAFESYSALPFTNISQLVVVEPSTQYRLGFYVRTEDLKSGGRPLVEVLDADGTTVLARTPPLPVGTQDWQLVTLDFKTPPQSEAVTIRVSRESCGKDSTCPIFGFVWYDDFNLQRASGSAVPRDSSSAKPNARG